MKKFLMYVIVLVTLLFVGYTTYYFIRNNETITLTLSGGEIYLNEGQTVELPIKWTKPYSSTTLEVEVVNQDVVAYDETTQLFTAKIGGQSTVTIKPSNENFGPFTFIIKVGDGSVLNPYYIQTEEELASIGIDAKFQISKSYKLIADLDLKGYDNWTPIGTRSNAFSGNFDGGSKLISNLTITSGTDVGLFGAIAETSTVSNVYLANASINGSFANAGAIVGINKGTVKLCNVSGLELTNTNATSNNGGIAGLMQNTSVSGNFTSFAYIDMCEVTVDAECSGAFGGFAGQMIGSVVYNSKATINSYLANNDSTYFGGVAGIMKDAQGTSKYMFSVIKNSYVVINSVVGGTSTNQGFIVGQNSDTCQNGYANKIKSVYYHASGLSAVVASSATTIDLSTVKSVSVSDLSLQATFIGWDFGNIWTTEEDTITNSIMFESAVSQNLNEYIPGSTISTEQDFRDVLQTIASSPASGTVYEISTNLEVDFNGEEWTTIAPSINAPMTCSIICADGATLTLKNLKISGTNSSFFGYLSGTNTLIKGIVFKDVTVNSNAKNVGVIAEGLLSGATIENCAVENTQISTGESTSNVGGVVAINNGGKVLATKVVGNTETGNKLATTSKNVVVAGITADNRGLIQNSEISGYIFEIKSAEASDYVIFGGIAGNMDNGKVVNCYNYDAMLNSKLYGTVYAGGVVGYATNNSSIDSCFSEAMLKVSYASENSYAGGVCANFTGSAIKNSYFKGEIQAYYVAGICQTTNSLINQCYFDGTAEGIRVAGLVGFNNNRVVNCYAQGSLVGATQKSEASGLVSIINVGATVEHCFSNISFAQCKGLKNAETESEFRATVENFISSNAYPDCGELTNCIIINYGDAYIRATIFSLLKPGWIECSDAQARGIDGDYYPFKEEAGFNQSVWTFDNNGGEGAYPTLTNAVKNPNA